MDKINLPPLKYKKKDVKGKVHVFDPCRQIYVPLTPEENVRQHLTAFLENHRNFPRSLIAVERKIIINRQEFRFDVLCYDKSMNPLLLVECKAPSVRVSQDTFDQVVKYNFNIKARYVCVSNGVEHFVCQMDYEENSYAFLKDFPYFAK
ncbi:MAG: type I restriction enzyme HsdR N-terminal domain-containing protein [Bacteroidales bacterium]